jgi:hypothetical protein
MYLFDEPARARQSDEERLAEFGPPVFTFVPQLRLAERGWSWSGIGGRTLEAQVHHWLADQNGNFWFEDTPSGPQGIAELRGYVFTDDPESFEGMSNVLRAALDQHLGYVLLDWDARDSSDYTELSRLPDVTEEIVAKRPSHATLPIDGIYHPAIRLEHNGWVGTSARVGYRLVTVVIHSSEIPKIDTMLTARR